MSDTGKIITFIEALGGSGGGGGGGGNSLVVPTFTVNLDTATCDMTYEQVNAAVSAKQCVSAKVIDNNVTYFYPLSKCGSDGDYDYIMFVYTFVLDSRDHVKSQIITYLSNGEAENDIRIYPNAAPQ